MKTIIRVIAFAASAATANLAHAGDIDVIEGAPPADAKVVSVSIKGMKYDPANLEIAPGTIVKWTNSDAIPHNVKIPAPIDVSGTMLRAGQSFYMKFNAAGDYSYTCTPHPFMKGKIAVK